MLKPGDRIGDWIVERALGAGGMGSVFLCRGVLSSRVRAAMKVLRADGGVATRERFVREVDTLASLDHPAIVRVLSGGDDPDRGVLYLFMDYVEGEDLESRLRKGPLSPAEAYNVFRQVVSGLAHAHSRGVTHRDIKPANIMLCADGTARIVDFGIAAAEGRTQLTREGTLPGTMPYVDPVAFQGSKPEPRKADVYATGLCLWESLTGRQAFPEDPDMSAGMQMAAMMSRKLQTEAMDPGPAFPKELRRLCMRTTEPEPEDRLGDMEEFLEQLNRSFVGQANITAKSTDDVRLGASPPRAPASDTFAVAPVAPPAPAPRSKSRLPMILGALVAVVLVVGLGAAALVVVLAGGGAAWLALAPGGSPGGPEAPAADSGIGVAVGDADGEDVEAPTALSTNDVAELAKALGALGGEADSGDVARALADLEALAELDEGDLTAVLENLDVGSDATVADLLRADRPGPAEAPPAGAALFERPVPVAGYEVIVHSATRLPKTSSGVMKYEAKRGWTLVVAEATVKNVSNPAGDVKFPFKFVDQYGNLHDAVHSCTMALGNGFGMTFGVPRGQRVYGRICTELPEGTTGLKLRFQPDMMRKDQAAVVPLGL